MTKNQAQARIERAERHAEQDQLIAGTYGELVKGEFSGCSVGCDAWEISSKDPTLNIRDYRNLNHHQIVADHDGTAVWFELVRDTIFEGLTIAYQSGLTSDRQSWWHIESAKALATMPEDVDWEELLSAAWITVLKFALEKRWPGGVNFAMRLAMESAIDYLSSPSEDLRQRVVSWAESARESSNQVMKTSHKMEDWSAARSSTSLALALLKLTRDEARCRTLSLAAGAAGAAGAHADSYRTLADRIVETIKAQAKTN
jgi:hypothetical protein